MAEIQGWFGFRFRKGTCWFGWGVARREEESFLEICFLAEGIVGSSLFCAKCAACWFNREVGFLVMDCEGLACALESGLLC